MDKRFAQHVAVSARVKDTLESWELSLVTASRSVEAHTLSAIRLPAGIEAADLLPRIVKRGVMVAGGLLPEVGCKKQKPKEQAVPAEHVSQSEASC